MGIGFRVPISRILFDSKAVMSAMDRATKSVFTRFGAFVRGAAKKRLVVKEGSSEPGHAPHLHLGKNAGLGAIRFDYDPFRQAEIIGPVFLFGKKRVGGNRTAATVSEEGGVVLIDGKLVDYASRPFMAPAFRAGQRVLPVFWRDVLKRT